MSDIKGVYKAQSDNNRYVQIKISDNGLICRNNYWESKEKFSKWNPSMGTVSTILYDVIVTNTGDIEYDGELYIKGGEWQPAGGKKFLYKASMQNAVKGTYYWYSDSIISEISIDYDKCTWTYYDLDSDGPKSFEYDIISWSPDTGEFETDADIYVVIDDDSISWDGVVYSKSGTSGYYGSSYGSGSTSISSALKVYDTKIEHNSLYTIYTGSIENTGKTTYYFVEIKGAFENSSGEVLDSDWTYLVGKEGIAPGESKTFRMSVPVNRNIKSCSISVIDYK